MVGGRPVPRRLQVMEATTIQLLLHLVAWSTAQLLTGQQCTTSLGESGLCKPVLSCESAIKEIGENKIPTTCSWDKNVPIVCCTSTREPGQKARKMCEEYSNEGEDIHFVVGGSYVLLAAHPYMASIGYGSKSNISWVCGGSLISKQYVLTAAHCVRGNRSLERWVVLGIVDLTQAISEETGQLFSVVDQIRHPDYKYYSHYHDIALLKLDRGAKVDFFTRPACLQTNHNTNNQSLRALGWGLTDWGDDKGSTFLKEVKLPLVSASDCNTTFQSLVRTRKLMLGIQDDKMLCAGLSSGGKDTCRGDSGGPLSYKVIETRTKNILVGVTSFGSTVCGAKNSPGVYTRVSYYVPWIESIVWP